MVKYILYWDSIWDNYMYVPTDVPVFGWMRRVMKGTREQCIFKATQRILCDRGANPEDEMFVGCN